MNKISVLDKGFVELVDVFGDDLRVVNAARVSFGKRSAWEIEIEPGVWTTDDGSMLNMEFDQCNKRLSEKDSKLIKYLAEHNHWTPFSHPQMTFVIKMPIFVARQWFKSGVGIKYAESTGFDGEFGDVSFNEVSRRYVDDEPEFYEPHLYRGWRSRPEKSIKQGSSSWIEAGTNHQVDSASLEAWQSTSSSLNAYRSLLDANVAPEMARAVLPQSMYTEFMMTASLAAVGRMYSLRTDKHAQWETQEYGHAIGKFAENAFPVSWKYLIKRSPE